MREALEFDLKEVCRILLKRMWAIVLCAVIVGASVFAYVSTAVPDRYKAKTTLYINNKNKDDGDGNNLTSANLTTAQKLVNTYGTFIHSDLILDKVIEETGSSRTAAQIRAMVTTESVNNTEMFAVYVTSQDPREAAEIANAIASIAPDEISYIIEGSYAKMVDAAKVPKTPIPARRELKTLLAAGAGALLAAMFFVMQGMLDAHVKTEEELERISDIPVLGSIPDFAQSAKEPKKLKKVRR